MPKLKNIVLPLLVLAFVGLAVSFLQPIFTLKVRWAILGVSLVYALFVHALKLPLKSNFGRLTLFFTGWCFATSVWSEVQNLSMMKAIAFGLVSWTGLAIGAHWVRSHSLRHCVNFLYPLLVVTFIAAVFGRYSASAVVHAGPTTMYQGMVGGPNMFGSMLAMCMPLLGIQVFLNWHRPRWRWFWLGMSLVFNFYMIKSASRSAFLVEALTIVGLYTSLGVKSKKQLAGVAIFCAISSLFIFSDLPDRLKSYVFKNASDEQGMFHTRQTVWQESWELAKKGGMIGGGFGVTIGESNFAGGLTATGYGREKGNSQMAILEETGWIGLSIYTGGICFLLSSLVRKFKTVSAREPRVYLGTITGLLVGMIAHSMVEAWWVAPGAPESMYFWIMAGVALGLAHDPRVQRNCDQPLDGQNRQGIGFVS